MPKLRRTQALYVTLDSFLSLRGKVLHHFDSFLEGVSQAEFPCIWLTNLTRAQLDEPRRRLGHGDPFIGESGCGVYLPEDYFHLKSHATIRLGRFTCIPVAKPQPAAAEALEELSSDVGVPVVSLRSLTLRELSQNTGLPSSEAERIRMRDFDELFFFAGASDRDIEKFRQEATSRDLTVQSAGAFWSLSIGADLGQCVRELGLLYDRAIRAHMLRVAIAVSASADATEAAAGDANLKALFAACDRTLLLSERQPVAAADSEEEQDNEERTKDAVVTPVSANRAIRAQAVFHLQAHDVWDNVLATLLEKP